MVSLAIYELSNLFPRLLFLYLSQKHCFLWPRIACLRLLLSIYCLWLVFFRRFIHIFADYSIGALLVGGLWKIGTFLQPMNLDFFLLAIHMVRKHLRMWSRAKRGLLFNWTKHALLRYKFKILLCKVLLLSFQNYFTMIVISRFISYILLLFIRKLFIYKVMIELLFLKSVIALKMLRLYVGHI